MSIMQIVKRGMMSRVQNPSPIWAHYTYRRQPDQGGASNFSFDALSLPLTSPIGAGVMVNYATRPRPIGNTPLYYTQARGVVEVGGNITGRAFFQPLVDPNSPNPSGIDAPLPGM